MSEYIEAESASGWPAVAERSTCGAVSDSVDEQLSAIDDLVRGLKVATVKYCDRPLDWSDVASLTLVREQLGRAIESFSSAETAATWRRASRQVASDFRKFRPREPATL